MSYAFRVGDGVAAPGEDCTGVVVVEVDDATGAVTVVWESGLVLVDAAADVVALPGARVGMPGAGALALRCLHALGRRLAEAR